MTYATAAPFDEPANFDHNIIYAYSEYQKGNFADAREGYIAVCNNENSHPDDIAAAKSQIIQIGIALQNSPTHAA